MSKRITMISFMNETQLDKVERLINNIPIKICKVPYGIEDENRYNIDNLPYHFTIFATNKENQNEIIKIAQKIDIDKIKDNFNPFYLEFDRLALYDYPGDMIKEISFGD